MGIRFNSLRSVAPALARAFVMRRFALLFVLVAAVAVVSSSTVRNAAALPCFTVTAQASPAEAGLVSIDPGPNCSGQYNIGSVITVLATANAGWALHSWSGPNASGSEFQHEISANTDYTAFFAKELESGSSEPAFPVAFDEEIPFFIDVPAGATLLKVSMAGTGDVDLYTRFGAPVDRGNFHYDCAAGVDQSSTEFCTHVDPSPGRWWVMTYGWAGGDVSLTATVCVPITVATNPPGVGITMSADPDCPGTSRTLGSELTLTAQVPGPASPQFVQWTGDRSSSANPLVVTVDGPLSLTANLAVPVTPGTPINTSVPAGSTRYFLVDVADNAWQLESIFTASPALSKYEMFQGDLEIRENRCLWFFSTGAACSDQVESSGRWLIEFVAQESLASTVALSALLSECLDFDVSVSPPGSGTVTNSGTTCPNGNVAPGSTTLTAFAEPGYFLGEWADVAQGHLSTDNPFIIEFDEESTAVTAVFAKDLDSGDVEPVVSGGLGLYAIDVFPGAGRLVVEFDTTAGYELSVGDGHPVGTVGCGGLSDGSPQVCTFENPAPGTWWITTNGTGSGTVKATIKECVAVSVAVSPPGAGTATLETPPNCPDGKFLEGTSLTFTQVANSGFTFAAWAQAHPYEYAGSGDPVFTVAAPPFPESTFVAYYGQPLQSGVAVQTVPLENRELAYYFLDVPAGQESFKATTSSGAEYMTLATRFGVPPLLAPTYDFDCDDSGTPLACGVEYPLPGRWWVVVRSEDDDVVATVTATAGMEPLCWSVTSLVDSDDGTALPSIAPAPNCGVDRYLHGTMLTVTPAQAGPDHRLVSGYGVYFSHAHPFVVSVETDTRIDLYYYRRLPLGQATNVSGYWYFDVPPNTDSLGVTTTGVVYVGSVASDQFCFPGPGNGCSISSPQAGMWEIAAGNPATMTVTLTPVPNSTIDRLSVVRASMGLSVINFTAYGSGFSPTSKVWWDGDTELATTFVSATELQASVPQNLIGLPRAAKVDVLDTGEPPSNVALMYIVSSSDGNCDGLTDAEDALSGLRVLAGIELPGACTRDANKDAAVNLADILWIRKEVALLVTPKPPPISFIPN